MSISTNNIDLSRESRIKLREIALNLMDKINEVDNNSFNPSDIPEMSDLSDVDDLDIEELDDDLGGDFDV